MDQALHLLGSNFTAQDDNLFEASLSSAGRTPARDDVHGLVSDVSAEDPACAQSIQRSETFLQEYLRGNQNYNPTPTNSPNLTDTWSSSLEVWNHGRDEFLTSPYPPEFTNAQYRQGDQVTHPFHLLLCL